MKGDLDGAAWRKSSRSGSEGNCVEVATNLPDGAAVRDSKDCDGNVLIFAAQQWAAFIAGVRDGEFDL